MATEIHPYSPKITGAGLPTDEKPILIVNYRFTEREEGYEINLAGVKDPFVSIDWPKEDGEITLELAKSLGAWKNTDVKTNSNPEYFEGLRVIHLGYRGKGMVLDSRYPPELWVSGVGSLLGSETEDGSRIKIPGIGYFIQPEVALTYKNFSETAEYIKGSGSVVLSLGEVYNVVRFARLRNPPEQWVKSEVQRFERNGQDPGERQLREWYRQLRDGLRSYRVRVRDILAWSLSAADPEQDFIRVPRKKWERMQQL